MQLVALTEYLPTRLTTNIAGQLVIVIPEEVRRFVVESKMPTNALEQLGSIVTRLREYLGGRYTNTVDISLSADPEYPEWKEIKIHVKVDGVTINEIYNKLWDEVVRYAFEGISDDIVGKVLLKLDKNS